LYFGAWNFRDFHKPVIFSQTIACLNEAPLYKTKEGFKYETYGGENTADEHLLF
jgi:hypothetical protein